LQNQNLLLIQRRLSPQLPRAHSSSEKHQVKQKLVQYVFLLWKCSRQSLLTK
jgi:hypothetical protein